MKASVVSANARMDKSAQRRGVFPACVDCLEVLGICCTNKPTIKANETKNKTSKDPTRGLFPLLTIMTVNQHRIRSSQLRLTCPNTIDKEELNIELDYGVEKGSNGE